MKSRSITIKEVQAYYDAGNGRYACVKKFGSANYAWARRNGLKLRSPSEAQRIAQTRPPEETTCLHCGTKFLWKGFRKRKYCSRKCGNAIRIYTPEYRAKISVSVKAYTIAHPKPKKPKPPKAPSRKRLIDGRKPGSGGARPGGGRSKQLPYTSPIAGKMMLNSHEIRVARIFDQLHLSWERNWHGFPYMNLEGRQQSYYPDFYLKDFDQYIEYKGWVIDKHLHKMNDSVERNQFKLLILVSDRYSEYGIRLSEIEADPNKLLTILQEG
jgi:hypothetical protein